MYIFKILTLKHRNINKQINRVETRSFKEEIRFL